MRRREFITLLGGAGGAWSFSVAAQQSSMPLRDADAQFDSAMGATRLELLHDLVPQATTIAILVNPNFQEVEHQLSRVQNAADALKIQLIVLKASTELEVDSAFTASGRQGVGALQIGADPFFNSRPDQFVALAARYAVPTMYSRREFAAAGGLASYGTQPPAYPEGRVYGRRILSSAEPSGLLFLSSTTVELVICLKTAKALGLTVPLTLLRSANELIE